MSDVDGRRAARTNVASGNGSRRAASSAKKWTVELYCFFLQVRHKFELTFLEASAKSKPLFFFQILTRAKYNFSSYGSYGTYQSSLGILNFFGEDVRM